MERRELLKIITLATGGTLIGADLFLSGCKSKENITSLDEKAIALLNEIGETILPATQTPGAKEANVGDFMKTYVTDCYTLSEQKIFLDGLNQLKDACEKKYKTNFVNAKPEQRKALLLELENEADLVQKQRNAKYGEYENSLRTKGDFNPVYNFENPVPPHYYTMLKQLTLLGYFTSEAGATKALRHLPVPGKYDGALPYKKGDKAFS